MAKAKTPKARITEVCAGVTAFLTSILTPVAPDETTPAHLPADAIETFDGKRVRVFPDGWGEAGRLARRRVEMEYLVAIVTEIPYLAQASSSSEGTVPPEWIDDQLYWIEANVFEPLRLAFVREADPSGKLLGTLTNYSAKVTLPYDRTRLDQEKLFANLIEIAYRESGEG